jgi:hypothetical protein
VNELDVFMEVSDQHVKIVRVEVFVSTIISGVHVRGVVEDLFANIIKYDQYVRSVEEVVFAYMIIFGRHVNNVVVALFANIIKLDFSVYGVEIHIVNIEEGNIFAETVRVAQSVRMIVSVPTAKIVMEVVFVNIISYDLSAEIVMVDPFVNMIIFELLVRNVKVGPFVSIIMFDQYV